MRRYQGVNLEVSAIYRFLDKLEDKYKAQLEHISFVHTNWMSLPLVGMWVKLLLIPKPPLSIIILVVAVLFLFAPIILKRLKAVA